MAWTENPDRTVPHFPRGACACDADLAGAADLGVAASHRGAGIPEMAAAVIQHDVQRWPAGAGGCTGRPLRPAPACPAP